MVVVERSWTPDHPVDLAAILGPLGRGPRHRSFRFERRRSGQAHAAWWVTPTPEGPGTLRLEVLGASRTVQATAWGAGAHWLCEGAPSLLGADDDPTGFVPVHPQVADAWRRAPGWRVMRSRRPLEACLMAVFEQKVTGREAWRAWQVLVGRFGEPAPGPAPAGMVVLPTPHAWREMTDADFHRAGLTPHRARTVRVAVAAASAIDRTSDVMGPAADRILRSLPGVGVWTSAEVRQRAHGDPDAVSFGDYHLAKDMCWWLTGERGDDDRMEELLQPYAGHRYRVQRLLELSGVAAPRRGPRMAVPLHRSW